MFPKHAIEALRGSARPGRDRAPRTQNVGEEFRFHPDDSARNCKMRNMMSLNCSICLMPIFGLERCVEFGLPKAVLPSTGEDHLWESKIYNISSPKNGIKQIEQFNMSPGLRKKAEDAQDALKFFEVFFPPVWPITL